MGPESTQAIDQVLVFVVWAAGIGLSITALLSPFMWIVWWVRKNNIKKSEELIEQNAQMIEEATFFKYNSKYNEQIQKQLEEIKELHKTSKKLRDEIADLDKEVERKPKKKSRSEKVVSEVEGEDTSTKKTKRKKSSTTDDEGDE